MKFKSGREMFCLSSGQQRTYSEFKTPSLCPVMTRSQHCAIQKKRTCTLLFSFPEKAMAPHSSTLAWRIPWTEEPGALQSMGSPRVRHDWATSLSLFTFMHWRRKWQPTPVFLPGESQECGSFVGCCLWGRIESDTTEVTWWQQQQVSLLQISQSWLGSL